MDSDNKISIRQVLIIFMIALASPTIRVIPRISAEMAEEASWVIPIFAAILFSVFLVILNKIVGKNNDESLEDVFYNVFGKFIGKVIIYVYIFWFILMLSTYLRYFADRITTSIFVFTPNRFFIATLLAVIYIVVRKDIKFFARYIEFFMLIFIVFLFVSFLVSIPSIEIANLFPVTTNDLGNVLYATMPLMAILSYLTYMFFLGDKISNKHEFNTYFKKIIITIFFSIMIVILLTVGILGFKLTKSLNLPFFTFFKNIEILGIIERIESILITFWIVTDFCIITIFMYIVMKLIKKNLNLKSSNQIATPIIFGSYILALYMASNLFEMTILSKYILIPGNLILGICFPIILLIIGKIRKKI